MVALHDSEERCKTWRGIYFLFQNWHDDLDKFWPKHSKGLKISKRFTLMNFFWPKYKFSIEKLCLMVLKIEAKLEGKRLVLSKMAWGV